MIANNWAAVKGNGYNLEFNKISHRELQFYNFHQYFIAFSAFLLYF